MKMEPSGKRPLLFVHSNGPTHRRDKAVKTNIRRHVMVDIGRARRKPARNPTTDSLLLLPENVEEEIEHVNNFNNNSNASVGNETGRVPLISAAVAVVPLELERPFWDYQHPLAILERERAMDMFSAYGITLMMAEGRNHPAGIGTSERTK